MHLKGDQKLYWSLSRPMKYMGLTLDEWAVLLLGLIPGIVILNNTHGKLGLSLIVGGIMLCYSFKKFKKLSEHFLLRSFLVAKKCLPAPHGYPGLLRKKVGK